MPNINAYLAKGQNIIIEKKSNPLAQLPQMTYGNKPVDGGNLILTTKEKDELLAKHPDCTKFLKKLVTV